MKTISILLLAAFCSGIATVASTGAERKSEPQFKLVEFHLALLKKGPKWTGEKTEDAVRLNQEHRVFVTSLLESGRAIIAGSLDDMGEIRGVYIFRAQSAEEAKAWANADPAVASGHLVVEM